MLFFIPRDTRNYFNQGCHCTVGDTKSGCVKQFAFDEFEDTVLNLRDLTKEQLDLVILGQLQAITPSSLSSKRKTLQLYICIEASVCVGKRSALFIQLVKKD